MKENFILFNYVLYPLAYLATEMNGKEKAKLNNRWQNRKLEWHGEMLKGIQILDKFRREQGGMQYLSMEWRASESYEEYVERLCKYYNKDNLGELAKVMSEEWELDINECFRYILCNLFNQFPKGFMAEDKVMAEYDCLQMYTKDPTDEDYSELAEAIQPWEMDQRGVDFCAYINDKLTAVQIKTVKTKGDRYYFEHQESYPEKWSSLHHYDAYDAEGHYIQKHAFLYVYDNGEREFDYE